MSVNKIARQISIVSVMLFSILTQVVPAYAAETDVYLQEMNTLAIYWYLFIRNYIAVPIMIVSFAVCGYRFFLCAFMGKPEYAIDSVKKQFLNSIFTLIALFALPMVMKLVKNIVESSMWTP